MLPPYFHKSYQSIATIGFHGDYKFRLLHPSPQRMQAGQKKRIRLLWLDRLPCAGGPCGEAGFAPYTKNK